MIAAKLGSSIRDLVWVAQPEAVRIRVPAVERLAVRAALQRGRGMLARAGAVDDGAARGVLGSTALRNHLAAVAVAAGLIGADGSHDLEAARNRIHACLTAPRLKAVLDAYAARDREPPADGRSLIALLDLAAFIELLLDNRSEREVRLGRLLWRVAIAAALVCALWFAFRQKNLASGKLVTLSSTCQFSPPAPYGKAASSRLVDGFTREYPFFGGCTAVEPNPWIVVDLDEPRAIEKLVVYGRSDCCWGSKDLPLEIQLSQDNKEFSTVAVRTQPFTDQFPWRVDIGGKTARYVRFYNPSTEPREILLNEIEIYGR